MGNERERIMKKAYWTRKTHGDLEKNDEGDEWCRRNDERGKLMETWRRMIKEKDHARVMI